MPAKKKKSVPPQAKKLKTQASKLLAKSARLSKQAVAAKLSAVKLVGRLNRLMGKIGAGACSCTDTPEVRGASFINKGTSQSYVLASPLQRSQTETYDCVHDGTAWSLSPAGLATLVNEKKTSVTVKAGNTGGSVILTASTTSHCKCRPAGARTNCACTDGSKQIEIG